MAKSLISGADVDLDARDPGFIRNQLATWWLIASVYFRAEVDGFEHVPDGPVLFVGNHSGGPATPDTIVFMLAHNTFFGVDRPLHALAHAFVTSAPGLGGVLKKLGIITAGPDAAKQAFDRGASVLVYPGGDVEVNRPWTKRHRIDFDGRKGFLKLAHERNVPIVPVVAEGGHDTLFVVSDGRKIAKALRMDRLGRVKVWPLTVTLPWGFSLLPLPGLPLPAKIRISVLKPIDVRERFGEHPDWDEAYEYVTSVMQVELSKLAAKRVLPPLM